MKNIQDCYENEVKQQVCEVHNTTPSLSIVDGKIILKCCCFNFKMKCYRIIIDALTMYKEDYRMKNLNDADKMTSDE